MFYLTGLRLGELPALTPFDVDFDRATLSITKSLPRLHGITTLSEPKKKAAFVRLRSQNH